MFCVILLMIIRADLNMYLMYINGEITGFVRGGNKNILVVPPHSFSNCVLGEHR